MRKLLVHLHLYYTDQCDYFVEKLRNIAGCEWDLHVTMVKHEPATEKKITSEFPSATIYIVENRGYDIRPFIQTIKAVDLDKYDFILKLHSKNYNTSKDKINGISYKGYALRDALVDSYLKSPSHFAKLLAYMESHTKAGMMCNNAFYKNVSDGLPEDMGLLKKELARIGIDCNDLHFCAGSMFLARACPSSYTLSKAALRIGSVTCFSKIAFMSSASATPSFPMYPMANEPTKYSFILGLVIFLTT